MNFSYTMMLDNFSLPLPFDGPDFSEYSVDPAVYTNNVEEYILDIFDDTRINDAPKSANNYQKEYHNIFDKFMNKDKNTSNIPLGLEFDNDDASWVMACTFLMFTLHTGYGLIECGLCGKKNQVNILIRNIIVILLSGFGFWCVGFAIVYGDHETLSTRFFGVGDYFYSPDINEKGSGEKHLRLFYQVTFCSIATAIPTSSMAERSNVKAFMLYAVINVLVYSFPANWIWGKYGWLRNLGIVDLGGAGVVHELGGFCGLVVATYLKPRVGVNHLRGRVVLGNAKESMMGLFMLWWGFLAFNSGTGFGVTGDRWMYAAKATVTTMLSSFGGGSFGIMICYIFFGAKINVSYICNCVMGSLVTITANSFLVKTHEAFLIGFICGGIVAFTMLIMERTSIDDPRGAFAVHGLSGAWGMISVGIFARKEEGLLQYDGLIQGDYYLLSIQALGVLVIAVWGMATTYAILFLIDRIVSLRTPLVNELLGADFSDHNILDAGTGMEKTMEMLKQYHDITEGLHTSGLNIGNAMYLEDNYGGNSPPTELIDKTRLSLSFMFPSQKITNDDIITYSKTLSNVKPRLSEGGGLFGNNILHVPMSDRSPRYQVGQ